MKSDSRDTPRLSVSFRMVCETVDSSELNGLSCNLSANGICMYAANKISRGQQVRLRFPDLPKSRCLSARVVWLDVGRKDLAMIGFNFTNLNADDRAFVERMMRPSYYLNLVGAGV